VLHAEVWPDGWAAWSLFEELSGQWRCRGMDARPFALDYTPLLMRLDRMHLDDAAWRELYADVRVLEAAALEQMARNQA
jgi:hypothetical protein